MKEIKQYTRDRKKIAEREGERSRNYMLYFPHHVNSGYNVYIRKREGSYKNVLIKEGYFRNNYLLLYLS